MSDLVRIELRPLGRTITVPAGTRLRDCLFPFGVEFPCGGNGRCRRCRVRVLEGSLDVTGDEERILPANELEAGWRLACRSIVQTPVALEIAQWEAAILGDDTVFQFTPREGQGIAVDIGTTTLVAQLVDLATGEVRGVRSALNPQAIFGADVMSRVEYALTVEGRQRLMAGIRVAVGKLISKLHAEPGLAEVTLAGNSVMHHLFCGIDVEPLSHYPFQPVEDGEQRFTAAELGWAALGNTRVRFLGCLGGFVGSDILAGIFATGLSRADELCGLIDLGTNGEMVFGTRERLVCASTAAGPAFEGGRISMGMRAATGAIAAVTAGSNGLVCEVLGGGQPRGLCGSGLVDAVAHLLDRGVILTSGRLAGGVKTTLLAEPVSLLQADIRELQLAKGAIAAGIQILLERLDATVSDVKQLYLAGAFGNYINRSSARRIGLLPFPEELIQSAGNTSLLGAKMALFETCDPGEVTSLTEHVSLAADPEFQDKYVEGMRFPSCEEFSDS